MTTPPMESTATASSTEVITFGRVLTELGWITTPDEVFDYVEKPHRYDTEFRAWRKAGSPGPDLAGQGAFVLED